MRASGVLRSTVLPLARLLVWAVIAVALCVLAFGRAPARGQDALEPSGGVSEPVVAATRGDLVSALALTGSVSADPATTTRATAAGTAGRVRVAVGDRVEVGTPLVDVVQQLDPVEQPVVTAPDGTTTQAPPKQRSRTVVVRSSAAGQVASLAVLADQDVAVGADVATVSPQTLSVTAPLTQSQQFRLLTPPATARAQAQGGPEPFDCTDVRAGLPATGDQASSPPGYDPYGNPVAAPTAQVTCRVPVGTTVFAGMSVDLTLELGRATGAVLVPVTAVLGTVGTGQVWTPAASPGSGSGGADGAGSSQGAPVAHQVQLGLTDGTSVEVRSGLEEGAEVLEFAPAPSDDDPAAASGPGGGAGA